MRLVEGRDEISLVEYKVFVKMHVRDRALIARVAWINGVKYLYSGLFSIESSTSISFW